MTATPTKAGKTRVAWVTSSLPPYRSSVFIRITRECPDVHLVAAVTHHPWERDRWPFVPQSLVEQVHFGPDDVELPQSPREHLRELRKAVRLIQWLGRFRPHAVLVHGYNDASRLAAIVWCAVTGTRLIVGGDSNIRLDQTRGLKRSIKSAYLHAILRCASAAFPFGTLGAAYFRRYGVPASRIFKFPAEPDYDLVAQEGSRRRSDLADRHGLAEGRRRLIYSGRLVAVKRVDLLIAAFAALADARPQWDLVILGSGPERDRLMALVPASLSSRVIWIPAIREAADVYAMYHACDALALPSDYEPWALVVNEAAASGLAIVCSDIVGAAADLLRDGENGRAFRAGDADDLRRALADVTAPEHLERYKAASVRVVEEWRRDADPVAGFRAALASFS